jgi:crotonobetaine/carnitine-CoA ligase
MGLVPSARLAHVHDVHLRHHRAGGGIRRNGDFVNAALVEGVLAQSPLVEDVFVYGVATPANVPGEKSVVAAVVLRDGATVDTLRQWAGERLQKNEVPAIWQLLDDIPKTVSEKPIERACIERLHQQGLIALSHEKGGAR